MAGYSRENEREADQGGFDRMSRCGYDPSAGSELFGLVDRELTVRAMTHGGYFWADHPMVKERIANLATMAATHAAGTERNQERYLAVTEHARLQALAAIHRRLDGKLLVFLLAHEKLVDTLPPRAHFYLAEGYRLRAAAGDSERATTEYAATIRLAPDDPGAYQALGLRYMHDGNKSDALSMLRKYVELEHDPARSGYAQQYIQKLQGEAP
jgi:predicted Zn-dependent protease